MKAIICTVFSLVFIFIFPLSAHSVGADPDLAMAKKFFSQKKYLKAVEIVAPCLRANTPGTYSNLEDCLFLGDEITETAVRPLADQYEKETYFGKSGVSFDKWHGAIPYIKMGISINLGHYGGVNYQHEFLHKLKFLFPNSKYGHVYEYRLISRGENSIKSVSEWIKELEDYRRKFPKGRYFVHVTADLAHAYDNLWDILRPQSKVGYYEDFSSGDRERDTELSEAYREKALGLYESLLKSETRDGPDVQRIIEEVKERYLELLERKEGTSFYILND